MLVSEFFLKERHMSILFRNYPIPTDRIDALKKDLMIFYEQYERIYMVDLSEVKRQPFVTILTLHLLLHKCPSIMRWYTMNIDETALMILYNSLYEVMANKLGSSQTIDSMLTNIKNHNDYGLYMYHPSDGGYKHIIKNEIYSWLNNISRSKNKNDTEWLTQKYFMRDSHRFVSIDNQKHTYEILYYYPLMSYIISKFAEHFVTYYIYSDIILVSNNRLAKDISNKHSALEVKKISVDIANKCKAYIKKNTMELFENKLGSDVMDKEMFIDIPADNRIKTYLNFILDGMFSQPDMLHRYFNYHIDYDMRTLEIVYEEGEPNLNLNINIDII